MSEEPYSDDRCSAGGRHLMGRQVLYNEPHLRRYAVMTDAVQGDPPDGRQVLGNEQCSDDSCSGNQL